MISRDKLTISKKYIRTQAKLRKDYLKRCIKNHKEIKKLIVEDIHRFYYQYEHTIMQDNDILFSTRFPKIIARFLSRKGFKILHVADSWVKYIQVEIKRG